MSAEYEGALEVQAAIDAATQDLVIALGKIDRSLRLMVALAVGDESFTPHERGLMLRRLRDGQDPLEIVEFKGDDCARVKK